MTQNTITHQPYRSIPRTVEAMQFTGDNRGAFLDFIHPDLATRGKVTFNGLPTVPTRSGRQLANQGNWVTRTVSGDFQIWDEEEFTATFERILPPQLLAPSNEAQMFVPCPATYGDAKCTLHQGHDDEHMARHQTVFGWVDGAAPTDYDPSEVRLRDRDEWNDHLANEVSIHILAVPRWLRRRYLRRVDRLRS